MATQTFRGIRWLWRLLLAVSLGAMAQPALAQSYPSGMIRIFVGSSAGSPPDIITRIVANELGQSEGWRIVVENKPGASRDACSRRGSQAAGGWIFDPGLHTGRLGGSRLCCRTSGFRHDTDFAPVIKIMTRIPRSSCQSDGIRQVDDGACRLAEEPARQAHILIRRDGHASPSRRRTVQASDRGARDARPLPGPAAGDRGSHQRHQPLSVHHASAGSGPDCHRQAPGARRHGADADGSPEGRSHRRRGGIPRARYRGLVRLRGQERHTRRHHRHD